MLITKSIAGLYNGVSQQPATMRLDSQCSEMVNCMSTIVDGVYRRPPTEYVNNLWDSKIGSYSHMHPINRDANERYLVFFNWNAEEPIEVFDLMGNPKTVQYGHLSDQGVFEEDSSVIDYLGTTQGPAKSIKAVTIADYTIVVNNEVTAAMDPYEAIADEKNVGMIYIKQAVEQTMYNATIDGILCTFTSRKPTSSDPTVDNSQWIAYGLSQKILAQVPGIQLTQKGSLLMVWFPDNRDFSLEVSDGYGDRASIAIKGQVSTYSDLPPQAFGTDLKQLNASPYQWYEYEAGSCWAVLLEEEGDPQFTSAPQYLRFGEERNYNYVAPGGVLYPGSWSYGALPSGVMTVFLVMEDDSDPNDCEVPIYWCQDNAPDMRIEVKWKDSRQNSAPYWVKYEDNNWIETCGYGLQNSFFPDTMPHRLVRLEDGTFAFCDIEWKSRIVGDERTAPTPSFIGKTITNAFFFKNRLGFISGDKLVFSKAGDFFNFWPDTALEVLDGDPIDISVASMEVTNLREALPFNKNLWLRADLHQFMLTSGDQPLTSKNVTVDLTTRFESTPNQESCSVGSNIYFTCPNGSHLAVREYFVEPSSWVDDANDITVHIPRYLPNGDTIIRGCSPMDMLIVRSDVNPTYLFPYKFFWSGNEKPQSSWGRWEFDDPVLNFAVFETEMYLVQSIGPDIVLNKMSLKRVPEADLIHMDNRVWLQGYYNPTYDYTVWELPYRDPDLSGYVVILPNGLEIPSWKGSSSLIGANGWHDQALAWVGKKYTSTYELSDWYLKDSKDMAITTGRLQHRTAMLAFTNTGYFEFQVRPEARNVVVRRWRSTEPGLNFVGNLVIQSGEKRFLIMGEAMGHNKIAIQSNSHLPFNFQSITHEGFYTTRSRTL
jgi:hypothetical protein